MGEMYTVLYFTNFMKEKGVSRLESVIDLLKIAEFIAEHRNIGDRA